MVTVHYQRGWAVLFSLTGLVLLALLIVAQVVDARIPLWYWLPAVSVIIQGALMWTQPYIRCDEQTITLYHKFIPLVKRMSREGMTVERRGERVILRNSGKKLVVSGFMLNSKEWERFLDYLLSGDDSIGTLVS